MSKIIGSFSSTLGGAVSNLEGLGRSKKQIISLLLDALISAASLWAAYSLRLGIWFTDFKPNWLLFVSIPVVSVLYFALLGVYRWVIRASNERLVIAIVKGGVLSAITLIIMMFLLGPEYVAPRSLFAIYALLFTTSVISTRVIWRYLFNGNFEENLGNRVGIYGAGQAGRQLAALLKFDQTIKPVCFFDDDRQLKGSLISGLPVLGHTSADLSAAIRKRELSSIVLAVPSVSGSAYTGLIEKLNSLDIPIKTVPTINEIVSGSASPDQIRDISITDLLGRAQVKPDLELMAEPITGKVVLVSGGGGSIGSEICRQVITLKPQKLIVYDQSEENLYRITEEIQSILNNTANGDIKKITFVPILGSVTNADKINHVLAKHKINSVYHAAAYKHVPIVEHDPEEAVYVNIFGTLILLNASIENQVDKFTLISTDKAVRPANCMGATKRIAELVAQAKANQQHDTKICMVRFGNVLGSSGSVVPKFLKQIKDGGPVTLTHPDITRYFMSIPEAAQLVIQASSLATGGEVFLLDMGEPVKIYDLAVSMIHHSGKKVKTENDPADRVEIVVEGLRPGEKLYEELLISEGSIKTRLSKLLVAQEKCLTWRDLEPKLLELKSLVNTRSDSDKVSEYIFSLVQLADDKNRQLEYQPKNSSQSEMHEDKLIGNV